MNKEHLKQKEQFLANIDTKGLKDDERLVLASKGWDGAYNLGASSIIDQVAPEAPEKHTVKGKYYVMPDYSLMNADEVKEHEDGLTQSITKAINESASPMALCELLVRLDYLNECKGAK